MAGDDGPLGSATPVATSATLGSGEQAIDELREFAGKVFGTDFDPDSVIGETRQTVEEACSEINYLLPIPDARCRGRPHRSGRRRAAFCTDIDDSTPIDDVVVLGERLPPTHSPEPCSPPSATDPDPGPTPLTDIVAFAPNWGRSLMTGEADQVERALAQYLRLLSIARRRDGERLRPLFTVEVQLWIREVSRLLRTRLGDTHRSDGSTRRVVDEDLDDSEPGSRAPRHLLPPLRHVGLDGPRIGGQRRLR